jgi:SPP1 family predicted phage head-tail adaptor
MPAGKYDTRLSLQVQSTAPDSIGQPVNTWAESTRLWADVRYGSGLQAIKADADMAKAKCSIRIRYRSGVTPAQRLVDGVTGTIYAINALLPDRRAGHIDLVCEVVK